MGAVGSIVSGVGGLVGAVGGSQKKKTNSSNLAGLNLDSAGVLEQFLAQGQLGQFQGIGSLVDEGPGAQDVRAGVGATRDLGTLLKKLQGSSGLPTEADITASQGITNQLFQPQQVAFQQQLDQAQTESDRRRAQLGRGSADPILAAKLAQEAAQGQERIGAAQGAATQNLAMQLPGQRLNFATQRASVLSGLGDQALQARTSLLGLGSQLLGQERNFRVQTADQFSQGNQSSGGGLGGALSGLLAGAGTGLSAFSSFKQSNALTGLLDRQAQSGNISPTFASSANMAIPQFNNPFAGGQSAQLNSGFNAGFQPRLNF